MPNRLGNDLYRLGSFVRQEKSSPVGFTANGGELPLLNSESTFAQDGVTYLLRDKFTADVSPLVDANASEGSGVGYRDVYGSGFYSEAGRLRGGNTAEGKIVYKQSSGVAGWNRQGGRTFTALVTPDDAEGNVSLWLAETEGTLNGYGLRITNTTFEIIEPDGNTVTSVLEDSKPAKAVPYLLGITLNEGRGAVYWVSSLANYAVNEADWPINSYPDARTLFISTLGTFSTVHPTVRASTGFSYPGGVAIEDVRLFDIASWAGADGMALAADRFDRADSASTLGGSWVTEASSTWGVSSNQAYNPVSAFNGRAYIDVGEPDVFVVAEITSGTALGDWFGLDLRDDGSNTFIRLFNNGGANVYAQGFVSNAYQDQVFATYAAFATSQTKRWLVACYGNEYRLWLNGDETVIPPTTYGYTNHETNTGFGLFGDSDSGQRWDYFAVYPLSFALPTEFATGAYPLYVAPINTPQIIFDNFSASNGTTLVGRTPDTAGSGTWAVDGGTWTIESLAAQGAGASGQLHAYIAGTEEDTSVQVVVNMPASFTQIRAGLVVRRADANNYVRIRCFVDDVSQPGNDEIEVVEVIGGTAAVVHKCYLGNYFAPSTGYTLWAQVIGDILYVWLEGELHLVVYLSDAALLTGLGTGLYREGGSDNATFDSFIVRNYTLSASVTVTGESFSASVSTSFGSVTAVRNVTVSAASLSATVSTSFGTAVGIRNVTVTGASLSASVGTSFGSVSSASVISAASLSASVGTSFGSVSTGSTATGASLSASVGTSFGGVATVRNVTVSAASLSATVSTSFGTAVGIRNVTVSGASLSATISSSYGTVEAGGVVTVTGASFSATIGTSFGGVSAVRNVTITGAALAASAAISTGSATGNATIAGASYSAASSAIYGAVSGKANVSGASLPATVGATFGNVSGKAVVSAASLTATVSTSFGSVEAGGAMVVSGVSLSASVSTSFGSVVAVKNVVVSGASFSASISQSFGTVAIGALATGASLSASVGISTGSVSTAYQISGIALSASVGTAFGSVSGAAVSDGASLSAAASATYGAVDVVAHVIVGAINFGAIATILTGTAVGTGQKVANVSVNGTSTTLVRSSGYGRTLVLSSGGAGTGVRVSAHEGTGVTTRAGSTLSVSSRTNEDD